MIINSVSDLFSGDAFIGISEAKIHKGFHLPATTMQKQSWLADKNRYKDEILRIHSQLLTHFKNKAVHLHYGKERKPTQY
jgi:hypothetical protein